VLPHQRVLQVMLAQALAQMMARQWEARAM
jgi:hypothetical protein